MSRKPVPWLPYWACLALWIIAGPLGAAAAMSGKMGRACVQAGLCLLGLWIFSDGLALLAGAGPEALSEALGEGSIPLWRALACLTSLSLATLAWIEDFFLMRAWHGLSRETLLGE